MIPKSISEHIEVFPLSDSIRRTTREERNIDTLLDKVSHSLLEWVDVRSAWLILFDRDQRVARFSSWRDGSVSDGDKSPFRVGYLPECLKHILENGNAFLIRNPDAFCKGCPLYYGPEIREATVVPLRYGDVLLGVFTASQSSDFIDNLFYRNYISLIAEDISYALWSIRLQEENQNIGKMYSRVMRTSHEAVITVNEDGLILSLSDQAESVFHGIKDDLKGKYLESLNIPFLYQKWLLAKKSLDNIYAYIIPEMEIEGDSSRYYRVYISRINSFSRGKTLYHILFSETNRNYQTDAENMDESIGAIETDLNFIDHMDLGQLIELQNEFVALTGLASIIVSPEGIPLIEPANFSRFCRMIRNTKKGCLNCIKSDTGRPTGKEGTYIYHCGSGGLMESRFPIIIDGRHVATWLVGQAREPGSEKVNVGEYGRLIGLDGTMLREAYEEVPEMSFPEFERKVSILNTIVNQMASIASRNVKRREHMREGKDFVKLLAKREEYFQGVLKIAPLGIVVINERFQFTQVNDLACSISGYSQEELINKDAREMFIDMDEYLRILKTDEEQTPVGQDGYREFEALCRHKNGTLLNIIFRTVPISRNGKGRGYVIGVQNVTEERINENRRDVLFSAVENSSDSVFVTDHEGCITYVNSSFEKLTGYSFMEVMNKNPRMLKSGKTDSLVYEDMWRTITAGEIWRGKICNRKKDGTFFTGAVCITPVKNQKGDITNYVSAKRDITEQLKIEEENRNLEEMYHQNQKEESIGRLAGGIAHDLNNMLTPILGYSELLLDRTDQNTLRQKRINQIYEAGERARKLVKQLLTFSRKQELEFRKLNLNSIIQEFVPLLGRTIRENIRLELELDPSIPVIEGDSGKIEQILMNLVVNSQDAMARGGTLTIRTGNARRNGDSRVFLSIADTGCGIDRENLTQIFEPFYSTKGDKGTGLGLANVQRIIRQHKGSVEVSSRINEGTVVSLFFPPAVDEPKRDENRNDSAAFADTRGGTVLLVEDDILVRGVTASMLSRDGLRVLQAGSGEEALKLLEDEGDAAQLLITDVVLPGMNGFELYRRFRSIDTRIRVLFMSGYLDISGEKEYETLEKADFIQKPLIMNELIEKVRALIM